MITRENILKKLASLEASVIKISASVEGFKLKFKDGSATLEPDYWSQLNCEYNILSSYTVFLGELCEQDDDIYWERSTQRVSRDINLLKVVVGKYLEAREFVSGWGRDLQIQVNNFDKSTNDISELEKGHRRNSLRKEIQEFSARGECELSGYMTKVQYAEFKNFCDTLLKGVYAISAVRVFEEGFSTPYGELKPSPQFNGYPVFIPSPYIPRVPQRVQDFYIGLGKCATATEIINDFNVASTLKCEGEMKTPPDSIIQEEYHKKTEKIYLEAETYKGGLVTVAKGPTVKMGSSLIVSTLTHTPEPSACSVSPGMIKEYKGEGELSKPTPFLGIFNDPQNFLSKIRLVRGDECDNIIFDRNVLELEIYDQRQILVFGSKVFDTGWMN